MLLGCWLHTVLQCTGVVCSVDASLHHHRRRFVVFTHRCSSSWSSGWVTSFLRSRSYHRLHQLPRATTQQHQATQMQLQMQRSLRLQACTLAPLTQGAVRCVAASWC